MLLEKQFYLFGNTQNEGVKLLTFMYCGQSDSTVEF